MNLRTGLFMRLLRRLPAMAKETFRESRSFPLLVLILAGGGLLAGIGLRLPPTMEGPRALAGAFLFGSLSLILLILAITSGAMAMARDRHTGFHGLLLAKPLTGTAYFLGRFLGLAARLTLTAVIASLFSAALLQLLAPDLEYASPQEADRITIGETFPEPGDRLLLLPEGPGLHWTFPGSAGSGAVETGLRFRFRPRYQKGKKVEVLLPLEIIVSQGDRVLLDERFEIMNRKSLDLVVHAEGGNPVEVSARITGGANALEITGKGCTLAFEAQSPLPAIGRALAGFLPALYLSLAIALMFSTLVSIPTALFSTAILCLLVLMGPSMKAELLLTASSAAPGPAGHHHGEGVIHSPADPGESSRWTRTAARFTAKALSLLPDPRAGGGMEALSRKESPRPADILLPWKEFIPPLVLILALGCLLARRRME